LGWGFYPEASGWRKATAESGTVVSENAESFASNSSLEIDFC